MIRRIIKILVMCVLFMCLLSLGGYTINSFKSEVHLRDPQEVMSPFFQSLPDLPKGSELVKNLPTYETEDGSILDNNNSNNGTSTDDSGNGSSLPDFTTDPGLSDPGGPFSGGNNTEDPEISDPGSQVSEADITSDPGIDDQSTPTSATGNDSYTDEDGNLVKKDIKLPDTIEISYVRAIKIKLDDKEIELTSKNTAEFIRWLDNNWHADAEISYEVDKTEETSEDSSNTQNGSVNSTGELVYDTTLANEANLNALVSSINVIDELPEYDDYDRTTYEKPVISYTLDGKKTNRNDYAWKTSPWYNAEDNTYMCPYTGTIIQDMDDNKQDNDFGNLDYDHIVPLKSTYLRGAKDWTDEQKNEYAYDQWVGVDVLNSANRSKSDKGPCEYLPDINVEDYCYSWLMICSKYNLSMTQEEIDICVNNITIALENGEEVTFLGGSYEIN